MIFKIALSFVQVNYKKKKEGKYIPRWRIMLAKQTKRFTATKVKKDKSFLFMRHIARESYFRAVSCAKGTNQERLNRKRELFVRPTERPDRDLIIENATKYSRIGK